MLCNQYGWFLGGGLEIFLPSDNVFYPFDSPAGGLQQGGPPCRRGPTFFATHFSKKCLKSSVFYIFGGFEAFYYLSWKFMEGGGAPKILRRRQGGTSKSSPTRAKIGNW